jgi:hypothetical protein
MNKEDKTITFESYYDPMLAHIILTRLKASNIPCFIADENILWAKPYFNQLLGGVKIRIFEKDLERCNEILAANCEISEPNHSTENDGSTNANIICPNCASANTRYGGATEFRFHLPSTLISLFFWVPIYFRNAWHCFNCHRDF